MRVSDEPVPGGQPDRREDEDRDDHDDRAGSSCRSAGAGARSAARSSGVSSQAGLVAGDRLVLGAVVLEDAAQVAQAREQRAGSRGRSPVRSMPSTSQKRNEEPSWSLMRLVSADRDDEEQADGEQRARRRSCRPRRRRRSAPPPRASARWREMPSALKPMTSDSPSATTPRTIGRRSTRCRLRTDVERVVCDVDLAARRPRSVSSAAGVRAARAAACGPATAQVRDAAHHHALEDGLAADGGVALRDAGRRRTRRRRRRRGAVGSGATRPAIASGASQLLAAARAWRALEAVDAAAGVDELLLPV